MHLSKKVVIRMKKKETEKDSESGENQEEDEEEKEEEEEEEEEHEEDENYFEDEDYEDEEEEEEGEDEEHGLDSEENLDENIRKVIDAVKKGLEASADCTLVREDTGSRRSHVYRFESKKLPRFYVPIEVRFRPRSETICLRFELSLGLHEAGEDESPEKIADWYEEYADYMEAREQQILNLGFDLEESNVDGIHHIYFRYEKCFSFNELDDFLKFSKKIVEEVWSPIVIL
jgi:hypothetical protein